MGFKIKRSTANWKHGVITCYTEEPGVYDVIIPDGVVEIGYRAFHNCHNLKRIVIPNGVTKIGDGAFEGCFSLTSIIIPDSVTKIGDGAFEGCFSLTSIIIPDSVTKIGEIAFFWCTDLTDITIPDSVTEIHKTAFEGCKKLTIIASAGSYAHTFARQHEIPFAEKMEIPHVEVAEENEPTVEVQKTVNPDGSYVEAIIDYRNNSAVIYEYDAQGNLFRVTHGTFMDRPEIPDAELGKL